MKRKLAINTLCLLAGVLYASDEAKKLKLEENSLRIISDPPGAHVFLNGRDRGATPLELSDFGPWAYETKKSSYFAKHLTEPITIEIVKDGFKSEHLVITRGPFMWSSFNHRQHYNYWVINSPEYSVRLKPGARDLTNEDVVAMVKAGLSDDIIIDKIRTSGCAFRTDPEDLLGLKGAGISNQVISAMMHANAPANSQ